MRKTVSVCIIRTIGILASEIAKRIMSNIKFLWLLVAVLFLATAFFGLNYFGLSLGNPFNSEDYYAVYLTSGDVYFGKLAKFPRLKLSDVYFLVKGKDQSGADAFALQRLGDAVWGPENKLYLTPENILWKTKLKEGGAAFKVITEGNNGNELPAAFSSPNSNENFPEEMPPVNASGTGF